MSSHPLLFNQRLMSVHKAIVDPDFNNKTVLVTDTWDYVDMWMKRQKEVPREDRTRALLYWQQAQDFYNASRVLPKMSSPLTTYYCALNAVKTLLSIKGIKPRKERHGLSGRKETPSVVELWDEIVYCHSDGIFSALCRYLGESSREEAYSLQEIFYNLPFIHRAYHLTYENEAELFIPISEPHFVCEERSSDTKKTWVCFEIKDRRYKTSDTLGYLPHGYKRDEVASADGKVVIRKEEALVWSSNERDTARNFAELRDYHKDIRNDLYYIHGDTKLWYVKLQPSPLGIIHRNSITLMFAAMHRISELVRYQPQLLKRHFDSQHNWLLTEFINSSLYQFIDAISSEITGKEFMTPGRRM